MKRKKFTFYKGYADAAEEIKEEFGVKAAVDFLVAVCDYCLEDKEPTDPFIYELFLRVKWFIDEDDKTKQRNSPEMQQWRKDVYARDDYTCQMCGDRADKRHPVCLNAHHIIKFSDSRQLRFDINNGITLCEQCHRSIRGKEKEYEDIFKNILKNKNND